MGKRSFILLALAVTVALPFLLRPARPARTQADDTLVVITANNEATRHEFETGFQSWYRARTGRTVAIDWRVIGGTSEITRFIEAGYVASFRNHWTGTLHRPWSAEVEGAFANPRLGDEIPAVAREARAAFLASTVSCGLDVFFGGASYDFMPQAAAGRIVPARVVRNHPEWFNDAVLPRIFGGETYWDAEGRWLGNVLSNYGILYNRDALRRIGIERPPAEWADLADGRYVGGLALADPTKSSSMAKAFENLIQQQMQRRLAELRAEAGATGEQATTAKEIEARAVREGWLAGLRLIQKIGANARYFTDSSQKPPMDVAQGDCAAGICIDFYGRAEAEVVARRGEGGNAARLGFATPRGGTANSVDPIALLRGAPHREVAEQFIEFTVTLEGQKLWAFRVGTEGGPERFALRRLPVRRDFYEKDEWKPLRSDPEANPFGDANQLVSRPEWTGGLYREMAFAVRAMCLDPHDDLVRAWQAINAAPPEARERALRKLEDLSAVSYEQAAGRIKRALSSRNRVEEIELARELAETFRRNYAEAGRLAAKS